MILIIGTFATMMVALGGGLVTQGDFVFGAALCGLGGILLGTMFAALQTRNNSVANISPKLPGLTTPGLTVGQLKHFLDDPWVDASTAVYVGDQGFNAAGGVFLCLLDGGKSLVIEGKER